MGEDKFFWPSMFLIIVLYGVMLGYIAGVAHDQCGGLSACIEEANK